MRRGTSGRSGPSWTVPEIPRSVRAVRILLYVAAGLTVMAALDAWLAVGGSSGLGQAVAMAVPAVAGVLLARRIARPGRWTWPGIVALQVFYLFWQLGRLSAGDPFGLLGLTFPVAILVLVTRPAARDRLRVRSRRPRERRRAGDRGAMSASSVGMVALVVSLTTGLVASGLPAAMGTTLDRVLCELTGEDCGDALPTAAHPPGGSAAADGVPPPDGARPADWDEPLACWELLQGVCDLGQGFWLGAVDAGQGIYDGARLVVCTTHLCGGEAFDESTAVWGTLFTTNPLDTLAQVWDGATRDHVNDWDQGHGWRSIGRLVPDVVGAVFGGKGINQLRRLPGDGRGGTPQGADVLARTGELAGQARDAAGRARQAAASDDWDAARRAAEEARARLAEAEREATRAGCPEPCEITRKAREDVAKILAEAARKRLAELRVAGPGAHAVQRHHDPDDNRIRMRLGQPLLDANGAPVLRQSGPHQGHVKHRPETYIDPMNPTPYRPDGTPDNTDMVTGNPHKSGLTSTAFSDPFDVVQAERVARREMAAQGRMDPVFPISALGPDAHTRMRGWYLDPGNPGGHLPVDFSSGEIQAVFRTDPQTGDVYLYTMYPTGVATP